MDITTDIKLSAWMVQKEYAENMDDAILFVKAIKEGNCPEALLKELQKNIDVMMAVGSKVTAEKVVPFLQNKLKDAEKMIAFWEKNPKDTNAVFYHRRIEEYNDQ